ncbi:MAG: hypothetical protein ACYTGQ_15530, partial [Planctomycetota bacterium]
MNAIHIHVKTVVIGAIIVILILLAARSAGAQWEFGRIADTNTYIPNGSGRFINFYPPAIQGSDVAFQGSGEGKQGIYTYIDGELKAVADGNTALYPIGTLQGGAFLVTLDGGSVAFRATDFGSGIFTNVGGRINMIATNLGTTLIPGGTGPFTDFSSPPSLSNGKVAFVGLGSDSQSGVYTDRNGFLEVVADEDTLIPGGTGAFTGGFIGANEVIDNGKISFRSSGGSGQAGIYLDDGVNHLTVMVNQNTPVPGGTGTFRGFGSHSMVGDDIAFIGYDYSYRYGIYTRVLFGGFEFFTRIADETTPVPGDEGHFDSFQFSAYDGTYTAFQGYSDVTGETAIYTDLFGSLTRVVGMGDRVDGRIVEDIVFSEYGFDGGNIGFTAAFGDATGGQYVAFQEHRWTGHDGGYWTDPDNWRFRGLPGPNVPTFIRPNHGEVITAPSGVTEILEVTLGAEGSGVADLRIPASGVLDVENSFVVEPTGRLRVEGLVRARGTSRASTGGILNDGEVELIGDGQLAGATLVNDGTLRGNGQVASKLDQTSSTGEVRVGEGQRLRFTGAGNDSAGTVRALGGEVEFNQGLLNLPGGRVSGRDATLTFGGEGLANEGAVWLSFGTSDFFGEIDNRAGGQIVVTGNSNATFFGDVNDNGGTVVVEAGSTAVFFGAYNGGSLGEGDVIVYGELAPGDSPGAVDFGGNLTLAPTTTFTAELGGTTPGHQYDRVNVDGTLNASGELVAVTLSPFAPAPLDTFTLATADTILGDFDSITGQHLPSDLLLIPQIEEVTQTGRAHYNLVTAIPGDFTLDGAVGVPDLIRWAQN